MIPPARPPGERDRLAVLHELGVLDAPPIAELDDIVKLAAQIAGVPIVLVSLVDEERQFFAARHGLEAKETSRDISFCGHAILDPSQLLVVEDARRDDRFADNPLVTGDPRIAFYAGAPIVVADQAIGTLCLIDRTPRELSAEAREGLEILVRQVQTQFALVRAVRAKNESIQRLVAAQQEATRLARIVDLMHRGVVVYAREGPDAPFRVVAVNPAAANVVAHPDNARLGALASDARPSEIAGPLVALLERTAAAPEVRVPPHVADHDGRSFEVDVVALAAHTVAIVAHDVTARVTFERSKDEFLAIAAHELRTPLAGISGAMGLLSSGALGELSADAAQAVSIAEVSAERLIRLTTDMLDLETMRQGRMSLHRTPCLVSELAKAVMDPLRAVADAAGVTLVASGALDRELDVDRDRCTQVFTNLVANAIRYAPAGSDVVLDARGMEDGGVRWVVEDRGPGISRADQARLFGRFVQLESPERRSHGGSGLGLAITRGIVELHGGRIGVESEPEVRPGTRFWVELPPTSAAS